MQTLEGHAQNVSSVIFHPTLPVILSGSEDGINIFSISTVFNHTLFIYIVIRVTYAAFAVVVRLVVIV